MDDILCISRLENMKKNAKTAERRLLDTVLSHLEDMDSYTISSLAKEAGVSYATVCRMLEKIGVSGFKEFKSVICSCSEEKESIADFDENRISNKKISDAIYRDAERQIKNCRSKLCGELLDKTAEKISLAGTVMFTGMGLSAVAAQYAYTEFFGVLPQCFFSNDMIMAKMKASILNKGDVLFVVSSSGTTKPVVEAAKVARSSGATVICLTDHDASPLADVSDIAVSTGSADCDKSHSDGAFILGQMTAINVLFACVNERIKVERNKRK